MWPVTRQPPYRAGGTFAFSSSRDRRDGPLPRPARKQGSLSRIPYIGLLKEDNAGHGFFERADFEAVVAHSEPPLDDFARFDHLTGWRRGEIAGLTRQMVDRTAKEVRPPTSKNGSGRVLPLQTTLPQAFLRGP